VTDAFRHRTPLQVRFRDTDAFGHVNNAVFATYVELARVRYLLDVLQPAERFHRLPLILARLELDFRSPIELGDDVAVETRVDRIGRTSIGMSHRMVAGPEGRLVAEVTSVIVVFDYEAARPIPVPEEWRRRVGAFENRSFETDAPRSEAAATG
jgi:acyl-CoA thioester hydrolase